MAGGEDRIALRIVAHGRVQGVWFRGWTVEEATARGLDGWVRNRADGTVEAVVAGPRAKVEAFAARCGQGPSAARVDRVDVTDALAAVAPGFIQKPSA